MQTEETTRGSRRLRKWRTIPPDIEIIVRVSRKQAVGLADRTNVIIRVCRPTMRVVIVTGAEENLHRQGNHLVVVVGNGG